MNTLMHRLPPARNRQTGAALVVGLILLLVLTLLAISGMNTATLELQMAGNNQFSQSAFQAAESGIEATMQSGNFNTNDAFDSGVVDIPDSNDTYEATMQFNTDNGLSPDPNGGSSIGEGGIGFNAYHFDIVSTGTSNRDATSTTTQSFYIIGPGGP
jgi:type IV pilus assembly protein PilX